jgi:hypothetical protein
MHVLFKVYNGEIPGDLQSAASCRTGYADLWLSHPLLWSFVIRGKEGPWQDALLRSARDAFGATKHFGAIGAIGAACNPAACCQFTNLLSPDMAVASRAANDFHTLLTTAARSLDRVDRSVWTEQVSATVAYHSGWMALLRFYKVLDTACADTVTPLCFRVDGPSATRYDYTTVPYDAMVHLSLYVSTARIVDLLHKLPLPTSLFDWSDMDHGLVDTSASFEWIRTTSASGVWARVSVSLCLGVSVSRRPGVSVYLCVSLCVSVALCVSLCVSQCLSVYLCVSRCLFASLCVSRCLSMPLCMSVCGPLRLSLTLCVSLCLAVSLCVSVCLSVSLCVSLVSLCLSVSLGVSSLCLSVSRCLSLCLSRCFSVAVFVSL